MKRLCGLILLAGLAACSSTGDTVLVDVDGNSANRPADIQAEHIGESDVVEVATFDLVDPMEISCSSMLVRTCHLLLANRARAASSTPATRILNVSPAGVWSIWARVFVLSYVLRNALPDGPAMQSAAALT